MGIVMETTGVLLMAYGGPDTLQDVGPYLLDVRGGRATSPELVEEISQRYAAIGGGSPLLHITEEQAAALERVLNQKTGSQTRFKTYVGMRHWAPRIQSAIAKMQEDGIRQAIALVMAPHYSTMSTDVYFQHLNKAIDELGAEIEFKYIRSWYDHPELTAAIVEKVREASKNIPGGKPYILFTAHSLPEEIIREGDPYPAQLKQHAGLVAAALGLPDDRWEFCFQSAGRTGEPWLGPNIDQAVSRLAQDGQTELLVVPLGFVADHVEVLYDIDIEAKAAANRYGANLYRSASLNATPTFIEALADILFAVYNRELSSSH